MFACGNMVKVRTPEGEDYWQIAHVRKGDDSIIGLGKDEIVAKMQNCNLEVQWLQDPLLANGKGGKGGRPLIPFSPST